MAAFLKGSQIINVRPGLPRKGVPLLSMNSRQFTDWVNNESSADLADFVNIEEAQVNRAELAELLRKVLFPTACFASRSSNHSNGQQTITGLIDSCSGNFSNMTSNKKNVLITGSSD